MVRSLAHKTASVGVIGGLCLGLAFAAGDRPTSTSMTSIPRIEAAAVHAHAERVFTLADQDRSGALDVDEYAALALVVAELSRLSGYVTIDAGSGALIAAPAPGRAPASLSTGERVRIGAVAAREFHVAAGKDAAMSAEEFVSAQLETFAAADLSRDGVLAGSETSLYAAAVARLVTLGA